MKMNLIDYQRYKYYKYEHKFLYCKSCEKICSMKYFGFFLSRCSCSSCHISNHKFIVYLNEGESKNNRSHHYNYYSYNHSYNKYYSFNNENNNRIFIESYHKVYHFLKNCFETFKRIIRHRS